VQPTNKRHGYFKSNPYVNSEMNKEISRLFRLLLKNNISKDA